MSQKPPPAFEVTLGKLARTVVYRDQQGVRIFTFDIDDSGAILDSGNGLTEDFKLVEEASDNLARVALARQRVDAFLTALKQEIGRTRKNA